MVAKVGSYMQARIAGGKIYIETHCCRADG
jgi:hypothetical protein